MRFRVKKMSSHSHFDQVEKALRHANLIETKPNGFHKIFHLTVRKQDTGEERMFTVASNTSLAQAILAAQLALASNNILGYIVFASEIQPKKQRPFYQWVLITLFIVALSTFYAYIFR